MSRVASLEKRYIVLDAKGQSEAYAPAAFWKMAFDPQHPKNAADMGYLVSEYEFVEDWNSWENHPEGDELIVCLKGELRFILELPEGKKSVNLKAGRSFVVPKNTWHTAKVKKRCRVLFMTWGHGTQHREVR